MPSLKNKRKPGLRAKSKKTNLRKTKKSMNKKTSRRRRQVQNGGGEHKKIKMIYARIKGARDSMGIDELIDIDELIKYVDSPYNLNVSNPSYDDAGRREIYKLLRVMKEKNIPLNTILNDNLTAEIEGEKIIISRKKENPSSRFSSLTKQICTINFVENNVVDGIITLYRFYHNQEKKNVIVTIHYTQI